VSSVIYKKTYIVDSEGQTKFSQTSRKTMAIRVMKNLFDEQREEPSCPEGERQAQIELAPSP
jgi:hypothetical protein